MSLERNEITRLLAGFDRAVSALERIAAAQERLVAFAEESQRTMLKMVADQVDKVQRAFGEIPL